MSNVVHNNDNIWIGKKFGRLTVIGFEKSKKHTKWNWKCKCDCGNVRVVDPAAVKKGNTRSCGCLHDEECAKRATKFKHSIYEYKRLHGIYHGIKRRCYRVSEPRYKDYGGRGIKMCDEWLDKNNGFDNFVEWALSHGYTDKLTIERNDVNGNYCPENCSWITLEEQRNNQRGTLWVEYKGERVRLKELCEKEAVVSYDTVHDRIYKRGWDLERALTTPSQQQDSFAQRCLAQGIHPATARDRMVKLGWSEEEALNTPCKGRGANQKSYTHEIA